MSLKTVMAMAVSCVALCAISARAQNERIVPAPTAADYAALATHPDLSGTWLPDLVAVFDLPKTAQVPWKPEAAAQIKKIADDTKAGKPRGAHNSCLPLGMPGMMNITHVAMEILATPGRITMLGESDGNNLRRIYTDGRPHPADPAGTYHGHSIGHWEGDTLVIDTVAIRPDTGLDLDESIGIEIGANAHVVERIHLVEPDTLQDDMTITAPDVLSGPWKVSRKFFRDRKQVSEILEGECLETSVHSVDDEGYAIFDPENAAN